MDVALRWSIWPRYGDSTSRPSRFAAVGSLTGWIRLAIPGLSLSNRGEHAFTEIQAFPLAYAPVEGKREPA